MSYKKLQEYYRELFGLVDDFHFNSRLTRGVYESYIGDLNGCVIPITHGDIVDRRRERAYDGNLLNLIFIGGITPYKGFPMLESVLMELSEEGFGNWSLSVWGAKGRSDSDNIHFRGEFKPSQLESIFEPDSLLIVPSIWSETFGLTVLEALSFGVPVLVSSTVGSRDIIDSVDSWFVYDTVEGLKLRLRELFGSRERLIEFNRNLMSREWRYSLADHVIDILELYKR